MKKINYAFLAIFVSFLLTGAAVSTSTTGGSSYRKVYEITFNGSSNFTWKAASTAPIPHSIEMTYATGVTLSNTFTLGYTRNSVYRELITASGTMHTITWYVPNDFYALEGDVWSWSNTAAGAAVLTINADYQY